MGRLALNQGGISGASEADLEGGPLRSSLGLALRGDLDADARACRVALDLRYAFSNAALEAIVSPVFDRIADSLVDSFVQRAEQVHGPR